MKDIANEREEENNECDHEEGKDNELDKEEKVTHECNETNHNKGKNEAPTEVFVIDEVVDHNINQGPRHRYSKAGEALYRVRWYGYQPDDDTWESTGQLPRSKILSYYWSRKLPIPDTIDQADDV